MYIEMEIPGIKTEGTFINSYKVKKRKVEMIACNFNNLNDRTSKFTFSFSDLKEILYDSEKQLVWTVNSAGEIVAEGKNKIYKVGEYLSTSYKANSFALFSLLRKKESKRIACASTIDERLVFMGMLNPDNFWLKTESELQIWIDNNFLEEHSLKIKSVIRSLTAFDLLKISTTKDLKNMGMLSNVCRIKLLSKLRKEQFLNFYRLCLYAFRKCGMCPLMDYDVVNYLGEGAFGVVYQIKNKYNDKYFALKDIECPDTQFLLNQKKEISNLQRVESEYIVKVYQWGITEQNHIWIIMENCEKCPPLSQIKQHWKKFLYEICSGLSILHQNKIIHRDIKPANILYKNGYKIADFGLSKHMENTYANSTAGTIAYMAPEIFSESNYSYNVDVWSLMIVMFEIYFGKKPNQTILTSLIEKIDDVELTNILNYMNKGNPMERPSAQQVLDFLSQKV